ncbi:hypothetical protein JQ581_29970 [Bradyrhizobium liaoningense]|uniref:hypothetical protein n=1 Tax=Bradyrhizobium liaoningense TaxID=43992 RepID=UPI001BA4BA01|nr:hypothetical protein [Bradyrhizobium liaoningense]MBR0741167.1 hypothetical protein [Bradyrhizobium liaoningense]
MTDVTQGADAPDENALFSDAVSTDTLAKFENPPAPTEPPAPAPAAPEPKATTEPKPPEPKHDDTAPVPPGRLREEAEARRRAERERDDLRAQMAMLARQQPPQQTTQQPQRIDLFENPSGFVQQELRPYLEQISQDFQMQREAMSLDFALQRHGNEKVGAARQALEHGMQRGDPNAWSTYQRAMQSHDPYGVIVRWHNEGETLRTIGGDLDGYRKRILEEALADPDYRKRVIDAVKGQAQANGNSVARPVAVASSPSLGNVGAGGGEAQITEASDADLFRQATSARRR